MKKKKKIVKEIFERSLNIDKKLRRLALEVVMGKYLKKGTFDTKTRRQWWRTRSNLKALA